MDAGPSKYDADPRHGAVEVVNSQRLLIRGPPDDEHDDVLGPDETGSGQVVTRVKKSNFQNQHQRFSARGVHDEVKGQGARPKGTPSLSSQPLPSSILPSIAILRSQSKERFSPRQLKSTCATV